MSEVAENPRGLLERLLAAINSHDIEALVACFHDDYENINPAHPRRGFHGTEQVRRNWSTIFAQVPDVSARVLHSAVEADNLWAEWELSGHRGDGSAFDMRGVFIYGVSDGRAKWARMFLEPVEETSGDADAQLKRVTGASTQTSAVTS